MYVSERDAGSPVTIFERILMLFPRRLAREIRAVGASRLGFPLGLCEIRLRTEGSSSLLFFGESVPMFDAATKIVAEADMMIVVGTSLAVYPAAMLVRYAKAGVPIYVIDPGTPDTAMICNPLTHIKARAAVGMPELVEKLIKENK